MSEHDIPGSRARQHGAGTYQMLWDCRFCGTEKLLGLDHRHCPNCGAAQDPAWRYFPAEEDMIAVEDHQYVGADRICPACSQPNSAAATYCVACGADLSTGQPAPVQTARELGVVGAASDTKRDVVLESFQAEMQRVKVEEKAQERAQPVFLGLTKTHLIIVGALVALAVVVGAIVYAVTYRKQGTGTVQGVSWERVIEIEQFTAVRDEAWRDQVPGRAYNVSCRERQRGTRRVEDGSHEECRDVDQGDGTFRRECRTVIDYSDEPVYDDFCSYTVDLWVPGRTVRAIGDDSAEAPAWPQVNLSAVSGLGAEREGDRREVYEVVIEVEGERHTCEVPDLDTWQQFTEGRAVTLELTLTGSVDCDSLQPQ